MANKITSITEVIDILAADKVLKVLVGKNTNGKAKIYPNFTTDAGDAIIYSKHTISNDKCSRKERLTLKIITSSMRKAEVIERRINDLIITRGDTPLEGDFSGNYLQIEQVGGGDLYDPDRKKLTRLLEYIAITRN